VLFPHADKVVHFGIYFILQVLVMWAFARKDNPLTIILSFCFSVIYGILLEGIQHFFLPDRFFEIFDIIANITGALSGLLFFKLFKT
jgi:VanZ family protein